MELGNSCAQWAWSRPTPVLVVRDGSSWFLLDGYVRVAALAELARPRRCCGARGGEAEALARGEMSSGREDGLVLWAVRLRARLLIAIFALSLGGCAKDPQQGAEAKPPPSQPSANSPSLRLPLTSIAAIDDIDADLSDDPLQKGGSGSAYFQTVLLERVADCTQTIERTFTTWIDEHGLEVLESKPKPGDLLIHAASDYMSGFFELTYVDKASGAYNFSRVTLYYVGDQGGEELEPAEWDEFAQSYDIAGLHAKLGAQAPPHMRKVDPRLEEAKLNSCDARTMAWWHLETMQCKTLLTTKVPRAKSSEHDVQRLKVPCGEAGSRFKAMFEVLVLDWLKEASMLEGARMRLHVAKHIGDGVNQKIPVERHAELHRSDVTLLEDARFFLWLQNQENEGRNQVRRISSSWIRQVIQVGGHGRDDRVNGTA
jgi:hypothetical protein